MARKKRKTDPAQSSPAAATAAATATNHQQELPSSELKPGGTIHFPTPHVPPESTAAAEEEDGDDEEDLTKLLELLSREQLLELVREVAEASPEAMAAVRRAAESDPASRKLFVHGLAWGAGPQDLRSAFSRFGEVEDCRVIPDRLSGKSKGYGFVLFYSRAAALRALRHPRLQVGARLAFCQLAASGPAPPSSAATSGPAPPSSQTQNTSSNANASSGTPNSAPAPSSSSQPDKAQRKIFVGNVHAFVDIDRLYEYFSQFGEIEEGPLGFDKSTGRPKGFALFVYKSAEGARRALEEPMKNFDGKVLNVQKATGSNASTKSSATTASAQMTAPSIAAINPHHPSKYGATAIHDMAFAQQAAMLGMGAQQQAFVQPNPAMFAMMAAAMQNPAMLAALNPAFAAMGAREQHAGVPGFGTQGFAAGGVNFPTAAGLQGAAAYQGGPPGFQGTPGLPISAGFQVGQAASQTDTTAAGTSYQAGAAEQVQEPSSQIGVQGGY